MNARSLPARLPAGLSIDTQQTTLRVFVASHGGPCEVPLGIVQPRDEAQIVALVAWANQHGVPLVPVSSSAGPRRRGDSAPAVPAVVVDLSGMNRMIHADGRDAIAVIEPGLTFPEFDRQLKPHGLRSFKPLLPRAGKSVLATYLEREPTTAPRDHWDTTDPLAALSFTMGSGEQFRTGGAAVRGSLEENLKRGNRQMMAIGPIVSDYTRVLQGSQGTLGIVSWASIYCERIPTREVPRLYGAQDYAAVAEYARQLSLRQLGAHCFILDRVQAAAVFGRSGDAFERFTGPGAPSDAPRWWLYVNFTAVDTSADEWIEWQLADADALARAAGVQALNAPAGLDAAALAQRLQAATAEPYQDVPRGAHRAVFCLSQLDRVPALLAAAEPLLGPAGSGANGGVAAGVYVQPILQGTSCHVEFTLFHAPAQGIQAAALEARLVASLDAAGGFFSRPYGAWSDVAYRRDPNIVPYLRKVKAMFDPNGVLNPKRLCF